MAHGDDELLNPLTGERIVFVTTAADSGGALLAMEATWPSGGQRAVEHSHPEIEERWEVLTGSASFLIDGVELTATSGEAVIAPAGTPHLAWNPAPLPAHIRIEMRPALEWERFVEELFALAADAHRQGLKAPERSRTLELLRSFPREIALARSASA
jgi:mannose-6-phosphate isomerase-like protein (cupin superfamily)